MKEHLILFTAPIVPAGHVLATEVTIRAGHKLIDKYVLSFRFRDLDTIGGRIAPQPRQVWL